MHSQCCPPSIFALRSSRGISWPVDRLISNQCAAHLRELLFIDEFPAIDDGYASVYLGHPLHNKVCAYFSSAQIYITNYKGLSATENVDELRGSSSTEFLHFIVSALTSGKV